MDSKYVTALMPLIAGIVTLVLVLGTFALAFTNHMIPDEIKTADVAAFTWLFISSAARGTVPQVKGEDTRV